MRAGDYIISTETSARPFSRSAILEKAAFVRSIARFNPFAGPLSLTRTMTDLLFFRFVTFNILLNGMSQMAQVSWESSNLSILAVVRRIPGSSWEYQVAVPLIMVGEVATSPTLFKQKTTAIRIINMTA